MKCPHKQTYMYVYVMYGLLRVNHYNIICKNSCVSTIRNSSKHKM